VITQTSAKTINEVNTVESSRPSPIHLYRVLCPLGKKPSKAMKILESQGLLQANPACTWCRTREMINFIVKLPCWKHVFWTFSNFISNPFSLLENHILMFLFQPWLYWKLEGIWNSMKCIDFGRALYYFRRLCLLFWFHHNVMWSKMEWFLNNLMEMPLFYLQTEWDWP